MLVRFASFLIVWCIWRQTDWVSVIFIRPHIQDWIYKEKMEGLALADFHEKIVALLYRRISVSLKNIFTLMIEALPWQLA